MSKQVDERVVSLQFDNKRFESNVKQSMSTLDKLKQKLNLKGASKGFEEVNAAAKKVDMKGLADGVETVRARFSALDVVGVTALANITNSAVNAGKQLLASLTVAPVKDGFSEYEMVLNAIQTTMAGTGKTAQEVQDELKKLDEYADKTVYSTSDMLNNLPKFTNAGVELENATKAMIGIANATALAGGDAGKASIAFYNLGQAIGTGYLTRMDYNSINNAGIATMEWKNQMVEAAIAAGTLAQVGEDLYDAGGKQFTLQQLFIDGLQEQWATTDVMMKVFGDYGDETTEIGKKSYAAAQDIKTFTMMMDSLKATAGTGWKDTWQIIFGDLDAAKAMWTRLANFISGIITKMADIRNGILNSALGRTFTELGEKVKAAMARVSGAVTTVTDAVDKVKDTLLDYSSLVDEIIAGKWGNAPTRWQDLAEAGYDWAHAQNLVNERLGCTVRHATNYTEAQEAMNKSQEEAVETQKQLSKTDAELIEQLLALSDAELKAKGYTDDEIESFRELERVARKLGLPISELIANIDKIDGRWLLIESFANIGKSLTSIFEAMGQAWKEIFESDGVSTIQKIADAIFNAIAAFHRFSRSLLINEENSDKLVRTFKGLFAILDLIFTVIGGPIKIAFKILSQILGAFDLNLLDLTAIIGDAIVGFHDWLDGVLDFTGIFKWLAPYIQKATDAIKAWFEATKPVEKIANFFVKLGTAIKDAFVAFKNSEAFETGKNIIAGLWQGIQNGAGKLWDTITNVIQTLIDKAKDILDTHSPSRVFMAIGGFIVAGLLLGLTQGFPEVGDKLKELIGGTVDFLKGIDFGAIFTALLSTGLLVVSFKLASALESLVSPLEGIGDLISDVGTSLKKFFKASALKQTSEAVKNFAISIAILVASVWVLTKIKPGDLWGAIGAIAALSAILVVLTFAISKLNSMGDMSLDKTGLKVNKMTNQIIPIAFSLLLVAMAVKQLAKIGTNDLIKGGVAVVILGGVLVGIMAATKLLNGNVDGVGSTLIKMSAAILLMVFIVKMLAKMSIDDMIKGGIALTAFGLIIVGLMAATKLISGSKNVGAIGGTILKIAAALLLIVMTAKIAAGMSVADLIKGGLAVAAFGGIVVGLMAATRLISGSKNIDKIGGTILKISLALMLMMITAKIAARMSVEEMIKGGLAIAAFGGIIVGLMAATKLISGSKNIDKIGGALFKISLAIAIMAVTCTLLGMLKTETLIKGITAIGLFSVMIAGLIMATRGANDVKGSITAIAIAIGVMAASLTVLSFIDPARLASATLAMGVLMGMFALITKSAQNVKSSMGVLIVLTVAIGVMAGALYLLAQLPWENTISAAVGLSLLMVALSASLVILSGVGKFTKDALLGVLALTAMAVPLLAFVGVLALMQNIQNAMSNVMALTVLATAMTLLLIPLTIVGAFGMAGLPYLGVLALLAMAVPLVAFVGVLALMQNIQNAEANANILIRLMTTMTICLVAISLVAPLALLASKAVLALVGTITVVGILIAAIGALVDKFPQLETFLDKGLPILEKIAYGIGSIFGNMISGFAVSAMSGLPEMGSLLSQFMINAMPFIAGAKMIDATTMDGVKSLAEVILILTAADVIQGLTSWLTGGSSITSFGAEIAAFGPYLKAFADSVVGIDGASIQAAANAAKALAEMTATIPNEGGIAAWFAGENSITKFASELPGLGMHLKLFSDNVTGINAESITAAADAAKALAEMTATIPNEGGVAAWFAGENSIAKFALELPMLGMGLKGFSDNVAGINVESVNAAVSAAKAIVDMSSEIPNEGGVAAWFAGDNSIASFSSQLGTLGTAISTFATNVGDANVDNINKAVKATKSLTNLLSADISGSISVMKDFGKQLVKYGDKLSDFCKKMSKIKDDSISSAIDKFKSIVNMGSTLSVDSISSLSKFSDTLIKVAETGIKEFVSALNSSDVKSDANKAISDLVSAVADKIETNSNKRKFKSAGKYLISGLAEGILANKSAATKAAQNVADAVEEIIRSAWQINSPSKVFYKIALGIGEGINYALSDSTLSVKRTAGDLADTASSGFGNIMAKVYELINSDMDMQPTIRPVLDLTDVSSGVNSIGSMLSNARTISVNAAGIGAISASMANRQNGNNDLASAINKLAKSNGKSGDTYNFNGFSYSEGSDVADAIQTLVRAAKIEGRT